MSAYLPFDLDEHGSSEFVYRINRPRDSKTLLTPTPINRLSHWSLLWIKITSIVPGQLVFSPQEHRFCNVELDINTSQLVTEELPKEKLPDLLTELVELATEIVSEGDVQ